MRTTRRLPLRQGPALLLVGILITACGAQAQPASDTPTDASEQAAADGGDVPEGSSDGEDAATDDTDVAAPDSSSEDGADEAPGDGTIDVTIDGRELAVLSASGEVIFTETLAEDADDAFQNVFHAIAVRPGATATDLDAIVATTRGEVAHLHHLRVRDGTDVSLERIPEHLQPQDVMESSIVLGWTPDADSVVWTEPTSDRPVLRTFGWDDGPGTGRKADDNATFALDLPMDVVLDGFEVDADDSWTVLLTDGTGTTHELVMERQGDGALALPG